VPKKTDSGTRFRCRMPPRRGQDRGLHFYRKLERGNQASLNRQPILPIDCGQGLDTGLDRGWHPSQVRHERNCRRGEYRDDRNWCGHLFAQANWYAFGRLAWDYTLASDQIADEWIRMTLGDDSTVLAR